jgi:F-box/leucine-rich repeat protein 2/20
VGAKKLKSLNLDSCDQITDNSLNALGNGCKELEHIDISWNSFITESGFMYLTAGCPKLTKLVCKGVTHMNDACLALCGDRLKNLTIVKLQKCLQYTNDGVARLTEGCPNIRSLSLSQNPSISDLALSAIGENCPEIRTLELSCCSHVTDQGFYLLTRNRPEAPAGSEEWLHPLQYLDVEECNQLTDATLHNFATNCPNLKELILSHCDLVTNEGIRALAQSPGVHVSLRKIKLDNCPQVTDEALTDLCNCPSLVEIDLYDCQLITRNGISQMRSRLPHIKVHAYFAPSTPPLHEHSRRGGGGGRAGRFRSMCNCRLL